MSINGTCYKCGKEYVEEFESPAQEEEVLLSRLEFYDPTDWECKECQDAEWKAMEDEAEEQAAIHAAPHLT